MSQYKKTSIEESTNLGTVYDYEGVMHYGADSSSKNGEPTIRVINDPDGSRTRALGNYGWTAVDILQVNRLYQCDHSK